MIDRAIGVAGLGLAVLSPVLSVMFPVINKKLALCGFIVGLLLLGSAIGIAFFPNGEAQSPTALNRGVEPAPPASPTYNKTEGGDCNFPGGTNSGSVNCGNTTNNFTKEPKVWRGWLEPANEPTPHNECSGMPPMMDKASSSLGPITILFANDAMVSEALGKSIIFQIYGCPVLSMERGPNGIMVDASISDPSGRNIGTIVNNEYKIPNADNLIVQPPSGDLSTLAVHDAAGNELLYFRYINPNTVKVRGIFACPSHKGTIITINDRSITPMNGIHNTCVGGYHAGFGLN